MSKKRKITINTGGYTSFVREKKQASINEQFVGVLLRTLLVLNKDLPGYPALGIPEGRLEDRARNAAQVLLSNFDVRELP